MRRLGIDDAEWLASAEAGRSQGQTVMFVAFDGAPAGLIAVADPIKSTSAAAIRALHERGIEVVMRSEEHTSELQSLMRISYAVFCLKKKNLYIVLFVKFTLTILF